MTAPARTLDRLRDPIIAASFAVVYVASLLGSTAKLGYARDEGFYFQSANAYGRWFELLWRDPSTALASRTVDSMWSANHEHPGLIKSLFALSNILLQKKLHLFAMEGTSYRFPAIALAGLVVGVVYLWGAEAYGRAAGAIAAVLLAAMPRFFFNAHLACFDVPIAALWTLTAYAYWKTLRAGGFFYPILTGILFGLALDTKHNSWFLPFAIGAHAALFQVFGRVGGRARETRAQLDAELVRAGSALGAMAVLGPLVFYALWPWLWREPFARFREYAAFHLNHEYYNMEFLGVNYWKAPMPLGYAWVMTAATVPTITLALAGTGMVTRVLAAVRARLVGARAMPHAREADLDLGSTDLLWLLGVAVNYAAWLSPNTPIFGGTKHWMTAYPFLALFAGAGFSSIATKARFELVRMRHRLGRARAALRMKWPLTGALAACVIAAPIAETWHAHPWGLSSYTPLVGGASGGATLGLNRAFWGYTTGAVVDYLNENAPHNATVYVHDTAGASWDMLIRDGRLRRDIRGVGSIAGADFGLYHHELHMEGQEYQAWVAFGTDRPDHIGGLDGVPVILVYKRHR